MANAHDAASKAVKFVDTPFPPFVLGNLQTGEIQGGSAVAFIHKVFNQIEGYHAEFELMPWQRALKELEEGRADAVSLVGKADNTSPYLTFSDPVIETHAVFFYNKERFPSGFNWRSLKDLVNLRIGVINGYLAEQALSNAVDAGIPLELIRINGHESQMFGMLERQRIDLFAFSLESGYFLLKQLGLSSLIGHSDQALQSDYFYVGVGNASPALEMLDDINNIIKKMRSTGELASIFEMPAGLSVTPALSQ
ncbi:substrate-binding periplasmic protein [Aestuariibacter salexigens]|uniref:substrate-binding periplasmic protein n=1 Tax=Aestuariibacter salexigens TaxID=226010 RepID=UPI0003F5833C|nr:transporter substrate-binding domain-containing protein [Aestuariibacter salexigens]